ncbi:MAG: LPS export ABC transporter periplasmic protein LptC [Rikenellaceae bacterium]|nr:LPS export ABC transporter periplasmic protein LptC [Rikenellaceae bacterium]MDE7355756.1 LPS export ABC transporter periplasmic protein LptC [Rikenellaceae bacterium]
MYRLGHKIVLALLVVGSANFISGCDSGKVSADAVINDHTKVPSLAGDSLSIIYYENGRMNYKFTTPRMERYEFAEDPYMEFPSGIHIETYDDQGVRKSVLVADYAIYIEKKKLWEAKGNVYGHDDDGKELYTEQIFWDEGSDRVYSNVDTKVIDGDEITQGSGFESDGHLNNIRFRNTKGLILVDTARQAAPKEPVETF